MRKDGIQTRKRKPKKGGSSGSSDIPSGKKEEIADGKYFKFILNEIKKHQIFIKFLRILFCRC